MVTISKLDVLAVRHIEKTTEIDIEVTCSAGTFIRAIARDLGAALSVGGHLRVLRRTRVANFPIAQAITFQQLKDGQFTPLVLADVARTTFTPRELDASEVSELSFGRPLTANKGLEIFAALSSDNELIALLKNEGDKAKPIAVFAAAN
jgi:tRNA pseudouridine55 synthase